MTGEWIAVADRLPEDDQRVLAFIPGNRVFLPGKDLAFEIREVIVLRFCQDYFADQAENAKNTGVTFGLAKATATTSSAT